MKVISLISPLFASLFLIACGGNNEIDNKTKSAAAAEVQPLVFEGYQNDDGDILYLANFPEENSVHVKIGAEEFILNKGENPNADLSNGEITLSQKDGKTVLKRNEEEKYRKLVCLFNRPKF